MVVACGRTIRQRRRGDYGGTVANPAMRWSLNVPFDCSDSLVCCMFGGMSWSSSLLLCKNCFTVAWHLVSIM